MILQWMYLIIGAQMQGLNGSESVIFSFLCKFSLEYLTCIVMFLSPI